MGDERIYDSRMSSTGPLWTADPVAANVRAELARKGVSINRLQTLIGRNQAYWQRRASGRTEFSHTDLVDLARLLRVDPGVFFVGAVDATTPPVVDEGRRSVRRQGLEPRTR